MDDPRFSEDFYKQRMPFSRELAAQAWCKEKTSNTDIDLDLAEEFAKILIQQMYAPHLGCATTKELLDEITVRIEMVEKLDYMTITGEEDEKA